MNFQKVTPYGYTGRILHVDLSTQEIRIEQQAEDFYRLYVGGSALALFYILQNTPAGIDAFDRKNTLVIALSPLTGAPISGQSRVTAMAKSPLTGCIGDSQSGGFFPAQLKFSGFDAIVVYGKSEKPVYLWIKDNIAELRPAEHLWGLLTSEVEDTLRYELNDSKIEVLQCGIAAEKGVRFACLINNANRANGRTGMGAVMASKNLKAIAVRGIGPIKMANPEKIRMLAKNGAKYLKDSPAYSLSEMGTAGGIEWQNNIGGLATNNWSSGFFDGANKISGSSINKKILVKRDTCYACAIRCKPVVKVNKGNYLVDPRYGGPEYETLCTFGSYCGISDLGAIAYANQLCNMYGIDTISCGATIAWAMDCYENGIITKKDTNGLELRFGNAHAMVKITEQIARREGFGEILGEGSARAAKHIGKASEDLVVCCKNQEYPAHMPQLKRSLALIYSVNPSGADHMSSEHDSSYILSSDRMKQIGLINPQPETILNREKVDFAFKTHCLYSSFDCLDVCMFVYGPGWQLYDTQQLVEVIQAVTGWDMNINELLQIGERKLAMMRVFNFRENVDRHHDILPNKLKKKLIGGNSDGLLIDIEELDHAKRIYYHLAGYDEENGIPYQQTLNRLKLGWLADNNILQGQEPN